MYKIGLTGGIASGKSTVSQWLAQKGAPIIDADVVAREVVVPGSPGLAELVVYFGNSILQADGTLNRSQLGTLIFSDEEKRKALNSILHHHIHARIDELTLALSHKGYGAVIYDIPLLIETNWHTEMNEVWLIALEPEIQEARLKVRNGFTEAEAKARIASQMPLADKKGYSQVIIDNNGTLEELIVQLESLWQAKGYLFAKEDS